MTDWTNDLCSTFMELYQMEPIIWDPKNPYHKDKIKVNDAWDRISKILNIPIQELKTKKISLMATFRGHLRRKKTSIKSGAGINDIYKPIWFLYELMESFLGDINECVPTINTVTQATECIVVAIAGKLLNPPDGKYIQAHGHHSLDGSKQIKPWENSSPVEIEEESNIFENSPMPQSPIPSTSQQLLAPQHPHRRSKGSEYLINEASKQMKDTFNTLNRVLKDQKTEDDECDLYTKLLAKKLRGLPPNERTFFMYKIDGMFINRLRNISSPATDINVSNYIPQQPTSSYSEPFQNRMRFKRPNSCCTSEPNIKKSVPNHNMSTQMTYPTVIRYIPGPDRTLIDNFQLPVSSNSSNSDRMQSPHPTIIILNHSMSLQTNYPPVLHIPEPNHNPVDNSPSVTILSDEVIVSPASDYLENFDYSQE